MKQTIHLLHIRVDQLDGLEECFAKRTELGWVIPDWLVKLRTLVEKNCKK